MTFPRKPPTTDSTFPNSVEYRLGVFLFFFFLFYNFALSGIVNDDPELLRICSLAVLGESDRCDCKWQPLPYHATSHFLGPHLWFSLISTLAFSIEDCDETIIQRDRASGAFFGLTVLFRCPLNATGKAGKRRKRATALNGHHLSHANHFSSSLLPSLDFPQSTS